MSRDSLLVLTLDSAVAVVAVADASPEDNLHERLLAEDQNCQIAADSDQTGDLFVAWA